MKNILFSVAIMSTTFSYSIDPGAGHGYGKSKMSKEDARKMKNRLMATGAVIGGTTEFAAVWNYAKHSPSTSKARLPLKVLTSTVAGVGGLCVGAFAGEAASDAIAERLMKDDASTPTELLEPHDKSEEKDIFLFAIELVDKHVHEDSTKKNSEDNTKKTEELVIEKS